LLRKVELGKTEEYRKQVTGIFDPEIMDSLVNKEDEVINRQVTLLCLPMTKQRCCAWLV
jgi:hypothetical protein